MNGRVYDPVLGRFLSVDPVFQFPTNTQSLNPYTYVLNNPLSLTDPTGYTADGDCMSSGSCGGVTIDGGWGGGIGGSGGRDANGNLVKADNGNTDSKQSANDPQQKNQSAGTSGDGSQDEVNHQSSNDPKAKSDGDTLTASYTQDNQKVNLALKSPEAAGMMIEYGGRGFFFTQGALDTIKDNANFEGGFKGTAFPDGEGASIGYGHHYPDQPNKPGSGMKAALAAYPNGISGPAATDLFNKDFSNAAISVLKSIPQTRLGGEALGDFSDNPSKLLGPADLAYNAHYHSNWQAFRLLRQHDFSGAASEFLNIDHYWDGNHQWNTSSQLETRRQEESNWLDPPQ